MVESELSSGGQTLAKVVVLTMRFCESDCNTDTCVTPEKCHTVCDAVI